MTPLLTIFTPTFNRMKLLPNLYDSLLKQSDYNFVWLVIDDGSTDDTEALVRQWSRECDKFEIQYYKKENGGLQSGYVEAIKHLETELAMCIDSDDCAAPDAVKLVSETWENCDHEKYAGILGLDCYKDGSIIGGYYQNEFPDGDADLILLDTGRVKRKERDRALAVRSDLYKAVKPAKRYPGERTINATYLHLQIAEKYPFRLLNEPLIVVEYQDDGISKNKKKQYLNRPNTFADWRAYLLSLQGAPFVFYFKNAVHYVCECHLAKRKVFQKECGHKSIVLLAYPMGIGLYLYLKKRSK